MVRCPATRVITSTLLVADLGVRSRMTGIARMTCPASVVVAGAEEGRVVEGAGEEVVEEVVAEVKGLASLGGRAGGRSREIGVRLRRFTVCMHYHPCSSTAGTHAVMVGSGLQSTMKCGRTRFIAGVWQVYVRYCPQIFSFYGPDSKKRVYGPAGSRPVNRKLRWPFTSTITCLGLGSWSQILSARFDVKRTSLKPQSKKARRRTKPPLSAHLNTVLVQHAGGRRKPWLGLP